MRFSLASALVVGVFAACSGATAAWGQAPSGFVMPVYAAPDIDLAAPSAPRAPTSVPGLTRTGSSKPNRLNGTGLDESIHGLGGPDRLRGGAGNDVASGDGGPDGIAGGPGSDWLEGDGGPDILDGGDGADILSGGFGSDVLRGGADGDLLYGDEARDLLVGDDGADILHGGSARDTLYGGNGNDVLYGDSGFDALFGGPGDDVLHLNDGGKDRLADCGAGTDVVVLDAPGSPGALSDANLVSAGLVHGCESIVTQAHTWATRSSPRPPGRS
jgi:Ca2+-binding RTX toxin-like protein